MSNPSFENIDQWLFEYAEGNLTPSQEERLLDFIQANPELIGELKTWKKAKITTPAAMPVFNSAALLKPSPFIFRPTSLVAMGVLSLAIVLFVLFKWQDQTVQYSKNDIDAKLIPIGFNLQQWQEIAVVTKETSVGYRSEKEPERNKEKHAEINEMLSTASQILTNTETSTTEQTAPSTITSDDNAWEAFPTTEPLLLEAENTQNNHEDHNDLAQNEQTEEGVDQSSKSTNNVNTEVAKSNFKKNISNSFRKLKRMMDQPTALRNTKSPYFHAPMMTGFQPNAAMVGTTQGNRIQATSRLQWMSHENSQLQNTVSWDGYIYSLRGAIGVDLNYNTYHKNAINNYSIGLVYSPKFSINKNISFAPALSFKMGLVDIDKSTDFIGNTIEWKRNNPVLFFDEENGATGKRLWYKDIGIGFMLNTKTFYVGFNADNLGRHNNNFYSADIDKQHREYIYYTAVAGTEYQSPTKDFSINAYALFQNYGNLKELWGGANFQYKWAQIGAGVNTKADFGLSAGATINRFSINYNIDYITSSILNSKHLSHQISINILLKPSRNATKYFSF